MGSLRIMKLHEIQVTKQPCDDELIYGMGSPQSCVQQLLHTLEWEPDLVTWSRDRQTSVCRGLNKKLGFKVKTYQGNKQAYTVIVKVNEDCRIVTGQIKKFDRIIAINCYDITHDSEQYILKLIASLQNEVTLTLCRPESFRISNFKHKGILSGIQRNENSSLDVNLSDHSNSNNCNLEDLYNLRFNDSLPEHGESLELVNFKPGIQTDSWKELLYAPAATNNSTFNGDKVVIESNTDNKSIDTCNVIRYRQNANRNITGSSPCESIVDPLGNKYKRGISQVSSTDSNQSQLSIQNSDSNQSQLSIQNSNSNQSQLSLQNSESNQSQLRVENSESNQSQLSVQNSDSNRSQLSLQRDTSMRRREKSNKSKEHKKTTKFVKTGSIENTDEEIEPLHPEECTSPRTVSKLDKYSHVDNHSYSMPTTVSVADIVVEDPTLSLPLGFNNVGQNHAVTCQFAMCVPYGDQSVCSKCATKTKPPSPSTSLLSDSQFLSLPEEYSHMILQNPQYAVWDGKNTHVVEIDKGQSKGFGFSYKVKVGKNQDGSMETYTLVESVDKDGPSKGKLYVADWVRSVNGTPIQIPMEAFTLLNSSTKQKSIRLVIQRPVRLSQSQQNLHLERDKTVQDLNPPSPQSPPISSDQDPLIPGTIAPKEVTERTVIPPNICVIDSSPVESLSKSVLPPFPKSVKLPKVRIFVCGSEAEKCAKDLLKHSSIDIQTQNQCYCYASFSMASDCHGNIVLSQSCSNLYLASTTSLHSSPLNQSEHRGGGDSKCKQCGNDMAPHAVVQSQVPSNAVNVELFVVPDEKFFHYCCCYLFTKTSIFIMTFDGSKMLRSAAVEFSRLENLSHTIRSVAGEDSYIMSSGLIDGGPDFSNVKDEVRALFYTPLNSVLNSFQVIGPELISANISNTQNSSPSNSDDENYLLQTVWKVVTETVVRQQVLQTSLLLIDHLIGLREREFYITESQLMEIIQTKMPTYQQDVHQMVLMVLLENREILLGKACSFISQRYHKQIESLILTNPQSLLTCLERIVTTVTEDKPNWLKTHSTGFVQSSNFMELCSENQKSKQLIADFMECNGIILRKPCLDSTQAEYFFPYFGTPQSTADKKVPENYDCELYLKFVDHESSQMYFMLLFMIGAQSDSMSSFNVQDVQTCIFEHAGYQATAYHHKVNDRIHFVFKREDKVGSMKPADLYVWLKDICHMVLDSLYVDFILGAPCPRGDNCSRLTKNGMHIINLSDKKPQFCDQERVDTMKSVKIWKQKDTIATESVSSSSGTRSNKPVKPPVNVIDLPHSVLHNVCARLKIPNELGRDWKGLAGLMGYTLEQVRIIETSQNPAQALLLEWNGKIDDLVRMLEEMNLENVLTFLRQSLPPQNNLDAPSSTPTQNKPSSPQTLALKSNITDNLGVNSQVVYQRSKFTETTEVMPIKSEVQGHTIRMNNLDGINKVDNKSGSSNQAITPVETVSDINRILKS